MITVEQLSPGVLLVDITGKLEKSDIEEAITAFEAAREQFGTVNLMVDMTGFAGYTPDAMIADARYSFSQINEFSHYGRIAVITGHEWIKALIWLEAKLLRLLDVRCFKPDERQRARAFANGMDVPPTSCKPAIVRVPTDRANMLAFRISGAVRTSDVKAVMGFLNDAYLRHDRLDLLVILDDFEGFQPQMLIDAGTWTTKRESLSHMRRYAVVGGPPFLRNAASFFGAFIPVEIKTFERHEEDDAWQWLNAAPLLAA